LRRPAATVPGRRWRRRRRRVPEYKQGRLVCLSGRSPEPGRDFESAPAGGSAKAAGGGGGADGVALARRLVLLVRELVREQRVDVGARRIAGLVGGTQTGCS
jgi:hypothetical protein